MRVLICGNCVWTDAKPIFDTMYAYCKELGPRNVTFISGMAIGADYIAYACTFALDSECDEYPWNGEGRDKAVRVANRKGVVFNPKSSRNKWMLDSGVDVCHAYAEDLPGRWSGTRDMVNLCLAAGVPCYWHNGIEHYKIISDDRQTHEMVLEEIAFDEILMEV